MISLIEGPPFPEFMLSSDRQRLTLQGLIVYDAGEFVITVANSVGSASARVGLRIQGNYFSLECSNNDWYCAYNSIMDVMLTHCMYSYGSCFISAKKIFNFLSMV